MFSDQYFVSVSFFKRLSMHPKIIYLINQLSKVLKLVKDLEITI